MPTAVHFWSHLDRPLREAFFRSFHHAHRGQARVTVGEWLRYFRDYGRILANDGEVFTGPAPRYGFDLSILPQSKRYLRGRGEPPPADGEPEAGVSRQDEKACQNG